MLWGILCCVGCVHWRVFYTLGKQMWRTSSVRLLWGLWRGCSRTSLMDASEMKDVSVSLDASDAECVGELSRTSCILVLMVCAVSSETTRYRYSFSSMLYLHARKHHEG